MKDLTMKDYNDTLPVWEDFTYKLAVTCICQYHKYFSPTHCYLCNNDGFTIQEKSVYHEADKCMTCNGFGHFTNGNTPIKGKGSIKWHYKIENCHNCNGTGRE